MDGHKRGILPAYRFTAAHSNGTIVFFGGFDGSIEELTSAFIYLRDAGYDVIAFDGHSDYGRALVTFHEKFANEVTKRSAILILGDARNNYHQAHAEIVADLRYRAKAVYWLNPEPMSYWNSGDSIVNQYEPFCDRVIECRTLRQLEAFVGTLA